MSEQETTWAPKPEDIPQLMAEAEAGNAVSQYNLGMCLSRGVGVEKNVAEGAMWLNSATRQGDAEAERILKQWWGD